MTTPVVDPHGLFEQLNDLLTERADGGDGERPKDIFELIGNSDDYMTEFWETGSVTVKVNEKTFLLVLNVTEIT